MDKKKELEDKAQARRREAKMDAELLKRGFISKANFAAQSKNNKSPYNYKGEFLTGPLSPGESRNLSRAKMEAIKRARAKKKS